MTIKCEICGKQVHLMKTHLQEEHPEVTLSMYQEDFPDAPLMSEKAKDALAKLKAEKEGKSKGKSKVTSDIDRKPLHEVFGVSKSTKGALNAQGKPIPIMIMAEREGDGEIDQLVRDLVPDVDENYIFNIDHLKMTVMGIECNIPTYLVGQAGTGKSTLLEQIAARTNRPIMRVQHTGNTEESHIVGQYVVKDGATVWEPGPLQLCMKYGIAYLGDEYDRALPQILSVYQPVLEGKSLVTKEAPPEWRIVKPHPDFRFLGTGNTNGAGDETGLFPSTALQDFANYERFGIMEKIGWMPEKQEIGVIAGQAGIPEEDAKTLVKFAKEVRTMVDKGKIGAPVSPRALINAAKIGIRTKDFAKGIERSFINRLGEADAEACRQVAQRFFG